MWKIESIEGISDTDASFSDGQPVYNTLRGDRVSSRLIVKGQGFLDITTINETSKKPVTLPLVVPILDFNGVTTDYVDSEALIAIRVLSGGNLAITVKPVSPMNATQGHISTQFRPFPDIREEDVALIDEMIRQKRIPYQNIPESPGKTEDEIKALGLQYFPFTPHSFQLAMSVYDWTTASFTRMVFMKIFEYTSVKPIEEGLFPLDENSVVDMIWDSNWGTYNPQDRDYMNSFLMEPADDIESVRKQLTEVRDSLHRFSLAQNRLFTAASHAMPRTKGDTTRWLFSGQMDVYQLGTSRFGIEFLQCPLNQGPIGLQLVQPFAAATSGHVAPNKIITTKMVWSFTDRLKDAMHYANGILLVAEFPARESPVWDTVAYITPLSDDSEKTEYAFPPGTSFVVKSVTTANVLGTDVTVIHLLPLSDDPAAQADRQRVSELDVVLREVEQYSPHFEKLVIEQAGPIQLPHRDNGRWCRCYEAMESRK